MNAKELKTKGTDKSVLIDVRSPVEFNIKHIEGAILIPLDNFNEDKFKSACEDSGDKQVVLICEAGKRAEEAKAKLSDDLQKKVIVLEGGMDAWISAGGETVEGEGCKISIDNQILVGTGALIVLAYLLSHAHHVFGYFILIVAGGLIYSGLVSTCFVKSLLDKLPWNQCPNNSAGCDKGG